MNFIVDKSIEEAVKAWIEYGLDPGSCTRLLLKGDYDEAFKHAHPLIKPHWKDHVDYIKTIPWKYRGGNMKEHKDSFKD